MELADIIANGGLVMSGALVTKIGDWLMSFIRARLMKTEISPSPLEIEKRDKYITRGEFNKHCEDNNRDHENLFARLNRNDMVTSEINGKLSGIKDDLTLIKDKLFGRRR